MKDLLQQASRSFYLTLRVLPRAVRPQIGLAYLLARTSDTIADTDVLPAELRLQALRDYRERVLRRSSKPLEFGEFTQRQGSTAERQLLERHASALDVLETFSPGDRALVREVISIIVSGQELDLQRFAGAAESCIIALRTDAELDDYTYRVAGCVGEFWTRICRAHLFPQARLDDTRLLADGVRFGKGLQLVNILRDVPADLRKGRCYLPEDELLAAGLKPADLLIRSSETRFRPQYTRLLIRAESHLAAGWHYTNTIPRGQMRVRLACAWPILIGMKTLGLLRREPVLDPQRRVKVTRADVKSLILRSVCAYPFRGAWERLFRDAAA